jgi:hypothetical protein
LDDGLFQMVFFVVGTPTSQERCKWKKLDALHALHIAIVHLVARSAALNTFQPRTPWPAVLSVALKRCRKNPKHR